ncbi:MAG: Bacterial cell division membrane protein [Candidatus Woesebacteria bacterium GW2011_GWC1_43_10b]|uniref:Probable peptidoglycan glycosyltransferase FtsW n=1 Tax=Candidatus Woesebacteria bacterium GW2011_GWC1_43_10b TaxID=1618585 RepID=A0A0G1C3E7_9BACT|nr:MAG: Bacterial cell division membrane protein [Candidatus Woesebacteria bacterium GW2011_GWC1_43_10b]
MAGDYLINVRRVKRLYADRSIFFLAVFLTVLGFIAIADVSAPQAQAYFSDSFYFVKQQILWGVFGFLALLVAANIHYSFWRRLAPVLFGVSILLLVLVLIPGLGTKALGARRWINFGSFSLQPSEIVKLTTALFFAWLADKKKSLRWYAVSLGLVGALIMLQPDLGTTMVVFVIGFTQMLVAGIPLLFMGGLVLAAGALGSVLIFLSDYRKERLITFLKGTTEPLGSSYHVRQILIALGSGGLLGVGLGQSRQKYLFLPEAATDSVFAIVAEEIGFIGSAILIIIFTVFTYKILKVASRSPDIFSSTLSLGIGAWIGGQVFLNLGSMLAIVPLTGIPLPFFSYGGSSLTMVLFGVGIILNISKYGTSKR